MIKGLNIGPDTLTLIEENIRNGLKLTGKIKDFQKRAPLSQALRPIVNKWSLMKLKSSCITKDTISDKEAAYKMGTYFCQLHL